MILEMVLYLDTFMLNDLDSEDPLKINHVV